MTENELIALVETRMPEELSPEEIRALGEALRRSAPLRKALAGRLEMEQYLHARWSTPRLDVGAILAGGAAPRRSAWGWAFGAGMLVAALGLIYAMVQHREALESTEPATVGATAAAALRPRSSDRPAEATAPAGPQQIAPEPAGDPMVLAKNVPAPAAAQRGVAQRGVAAPAVAAPAAAPPALVALAESPKASDPKASDPKPPDLKPPAEQRSPAPGPNDPWKPLAEIASQPSPSEAALAADLPSGASAPSLDELKRWFADVPNQPSNFATHNHWNVPCGVFSGLVRLKSPWAPEVALRMSLFDFNRLRIHLWNGRQGVTLHYIHGQNRAWVAYRATRQSTEPIPETLLLLGHDEGRNARVNVSVTETSTMDLGCDGKTLALSRRDIPLLRVPFEGLPTEVIFEGRAVVRQLRLVRAAELPPESPPGPVTLDVVDPAKQDWQTELPPGATFNLLADGRVELTAQKSSKPAWAALPLANDRIQEVILQLDDPEPGSGVFLGDASGKAAAGLSFYREQRSGRLVVAQGNSHDPRSETHLDPQDGLQTYCSSQPWVKMFVGCGVNRFWISEDGEHWARCCDPWLNQRAALGSVGLYCAPGPRPHGIRLRRVITRELPLLASLAPGELRRRAPTPTTDMSPSEWLSAACLGQPADVDARAWLRACAVRTLAANAAPSAAAAVLDHLVEDALADPERSWDERLQLLDESSRLRPCWDDRRLAQRCETLYSQVASQAAAAGHPELFARAIQAELMSPLWTRRDPATAIEDGDRRQILQLAYNADWRQARELSQYLRLTRKLNQDQEGILDWVDSLSPRRAGDQAANGKGLQKPEWRHPLIAELSKEAYNVLAELQAALEGKAYRDACQIISNAGAQGGGAVSGPGLLPDSRDADLLISFPNAVRLAMRDHPPLASTMNEQFGAVGRLRVRQAIAEEDAVAVEAVALQFFGTPAAAEGRLWLADRALAGGAFAQAIANYSECLETAAPELKPRASAGMQLAAAMLGRPAPPGAVDRAVFGDVKLSAAQFAELLAGLRRSRPAGAASPAAPSVEPDQLAPGPGAFSAQIRARFDGDAGENFQQVPGEILQADLDWVARQCAVAPAGNRLIVSNRFQVSAFDAPSGNFAWRTPLGGEQGGALDWPLVPMRPQLTADRVFVRRLIKAGPQLAALSLSEGKLLWTTRPEPERFLVSDPVWIQEQLFAMTAARADQEYLLALASFDPTSGAPLRSRPLIRLREGWWPQRSCQATPVDDGLVIACGGSVLRVDVDGRVGWLRRQLLTPASLDRGAGLQEPSAPIIQGNRVIVTQPGVREIECLELGSGRLVWQAATPALARIVALVDGRLVFQTDAGLSALAADDGKPLWTCPLEKVQDALAPAGQGTLLAVKNVPVGDDRNLTPTLVWIDLASGEQIARQGLDALRSERPRMGPLAMVDHRLLAFSGEAGRGPQRDIVELAPQVGGAGREGDAGAASPRGGRDEAGELAAIDIWRQPLDAALREAVAEVLPDWTLLGGPTDRKHVIRLDAWQGEPSAIEAQSAAGRPFTLARRVKIPAGSPKLVARVASDAAWKIEVNAGSQTIASQTLDRDANGGWKDLAWSLESVAGQTIWLVVRQIDRDGSQPLVKWRSLRIQ